MANTYSNLTRDELLEHAQRKEEGTFASNGAFTVTTGKRTGRSPKDKYIVQDSTTKDTVAWGAVNQSMDTEIFDTLWEKAEAHMKTVDHYIGSYQVGADLKFGLNVKVTTELAWHQLFAMNLFIPSDGQKANGNDWTMMNACTLALDPNVDGTNSDGVVIINFSEKKVLLCGIRYAGEMKKSMFSVLNFLLPDQGVLPMHCSANVLKKEQVDEPDNVTIFFGLSGTGKTTLSADPGTLLIGDDEHGWSDDGIFNFEGGCYAKCINLSQENEPVIWDAIRKGTVLENVVLNEDSSPNYNYGTITENTRAAYPREHIDGRVLENKAGLPSAVIFLTCDLYGVLPPVAKLTNDQAAYYFLSGYTALVGSTEVGQSKGIKPTFSTCFGEPFFAKPAKVYSDLLKQRLEADGCPVYLVNTGWTGGAYGEGGKRFSIPTTRNIIHAIQKGGIKNQFTILPGFNFSIPTSLPGVETELLDPRNGWSDINAYNDKANILIEQFQNNFKKYNLPDTAEPKIIK